MAASFFAVELPTSKRQERKKSSWGTLNKYDFLPCIFRSNRTVYVSVGGSVFHKFTCNRLFVWAAAATIGRSPIPQWGSGNGSSSLPGQECDFYRDGIGYNSCHDGTNASKCSEIMSKNNDDWMEQVSYKWSFNFNGLGHVIVGHVSCCIR